MTIENLLIKKKQHRIKIGLDPTSQTLHLGHLVILNQIKELQKMGHYILCIIGTYTAQIGDPSGKNKKRKSLHKKIIFYNCKTYEKQILHILNKKNLKFLYNSTWLEKLNSTTLLKLLTMYTVSKLLERKDFKNRLKKKKPLSLSELIYPILQGYDSVIINASLEIGGNDQKFNLSFGRFLQKKNNQIPQIVHTIPLLKGIDGIKKMSKTAKNSIDFTETKRNMFGKIMKLNDSLLQEYYLLVFKKKNINIKNIIKAKLNLAFRAVKIFFSREDAKNEKNFFIERYCKKKRNLQEITHTFYIRKYEKLSIILEKININLSKKQIKRLFFQNAIKLQDNSILNRKSTIEKNSLIFIGKKITIAVREKINNTLT